jgi:cyclic pyranopterin phosphate synthase
MRDGGYVNVSRPVAGLPQGLSEASAAGGSAEVEARSHATRRQALRDGCGRQVKQLRVSVTPACDLRCTYCRPRGRVTTDRQSLSDEHRLEFVQFLRERWQLSQVRITGGEPLCHPSLASFVASLRDALPGIILTLTTNGRLLRRYAAALREAGLTRLNVSVDSVNPRTYRRITGGDLEPVLAGLDAAEEAGFPPPKVNSVVLRGLNNEEVPALARWALASGREIRFLEAMPIGPAAELNRRRFVAADEVLDSLEDEFELTALAPEPEGTARRYRTTGNGCSGVVGLIAPVSKPFCGGCGRIRLTADGRLYPCLLDSRCVDVTRAWSGGRFSATTAARLVEQAVAVKRPEGLQRQAAAMVTLGG